MAAPLQAFGPVHLAIVTTVPAIAALLLSWARGNPVRVRRAAVVIGAALAANELAWYGFVLASGWIQPPHGLPLDLCDVVLWLTVYALVAARPWALEGAYYLGLAGAGMAVLTPDLEAAFPSYAGVKFFVGHGGVVAAVLFLVWSGAFRPRPGSWWRVFLATNAYAALVLLFDLAFGTNYMYLREKPESATLLDVLGPWPWYVVAGDVVALVLLWLMSLPFPSGRGVRRRAASAGVLRRRRAVE